MAPPAGWRPRIRADQAARAAAAQPWGLRSRVVQVPVVVAAATGVVAAAVAAAPLSVLGVEGVAPALARLARRSRTRRNQATGWYRSATRRRRQGRRSCAF